MTGKMLEVTPGSGEAEEEKVIAVCRQHADMTFFYRGDMQFPVDGTTGELHGDFDLLKRVLADRATYTRVRLVTEGGRVLLCFPAYLYDFIEDVRARAIHHKIEGSGYVYRECVWRRTIRLREYDGLFSHAVDEGGRAPIEIAFGRLLAPVDLAPGHREKYERYLEKRAFESVMYLLNLNYNKRVKTDVATADLPFPWNPMDALALLTERMLIDRETVAEILPYCDTPERAEAATMLIAYEKAHWGKRRGQRMTLDLP